MSLAEPDHRVAAPAVNLAHLRHLTTPLGLWEHAAYSSPRRDHGFCTDDNARALILVCREHAGGPGSDLAEIYLRFLRAALTVDGRFHNRRHADGRWLDDVGSDDSQGRALWALGVAARHGHEAEIRTEARGIFHAAAGSFRSPHLRANAFATLGAAELAGTDRDAEALLRRTSTVIADAVRNAPGASSPDVHWPWPEPRLTYDNPRLPEALLAAGEHLGDPATVDLGRELLTWLVSIERPVDHFSFTPVGGWTSGEPRPGFDQQPVEVAAMVDACTRAARMTGTTWWAEQAQQAAAWFLGVNDTGRWLYDPETGGCFDGLEEDDINANQGAESTLAALTSLQAVAR